MEFTLSSRCSRSDPPLFRQGAAVTHFDSLPPHDLVLWTDGFVPFPFGKAALAYLPTGYFVALRPLSPFWHAQNVQVFPLKPASFFAGLGSANMSATSLFISSVVVVVYPTPSEGWGHGGKPWSPRSRATSQGLDQRS